MSFANPLELLLLLTVPLLVLLYFLKLKRPQVRVASTLLWQKVIEDMRVNSPFQKLRRSLLLFLQLLALLCVIFALARPVLLVREDRKESMIMLLDNSASMAAVEPGGKTRLELAKAEALRLADGLSKDDEMMLISFNSRARVLCSFTANRRLLKNAISGVKPTECATVIDPALLLAKSIANSRGRARLVLFSDGAFRQTTPIDLPTEVEFRTIGAARPNLAITGLDIRRSLNDKSRIEMFVAVENFSQESFSGNMAVSLDDKMLDNKFFSIAPGETLSQVFEALLPGGGNVKVEFAAKDSLACDNSAWKVIRPPVHRRVLIVGDKNAFFVERALKASPGVDYTVIAESEYTDAEAAGFSTVIWNAAARPVLAPCNNIFLGCVPAIEGVAAHGTVEAPDILDWDNSHPVNGFIDFDNLVLQSSTRLSLPEYAAVLLRSTGTPLIALMETGGRGVCIVGFDPMQSNWPLLVSFPLFLNNCFDYFEEQQSKKTDSNIPAGTTITMRGPSTAPSLLLPSGEKRRMTEAPGGSYAFADTDICGIYRIETPGGETQSIAVNLFDRYESQLDTTNSLTIGGKVVKAVASHKQINREYWKHLVMALLGLLALEWIVYHRRWLV